MFVAERFKTKLPNDKKSHENSVSFDNEVGSTELKDQLLSLADFSENSVQPAMVKQSLNSNSGNSFTQMQNATINENPKKRPFSKPCPKSKKKRIQLTNSNDEERKIDDDLVGLASSINADKDLNSDSSNEAVIEFDDAIFISGDSVFNLKTNSFSDVNSHNVKTASNSSFFSRKPFLTTDGTKDHTSVEKKKGVEVKSCAPEVKEMASSFSRNTVSHLSSTLHSNSLLTESSKLSESPKDVTKNNSEVLQNVSKVGNLYQSILCNNSSGVCQNNKALNSQSAYGSVGLDEDLCDTGKKLKRVSNNAVAKETIDITSSPEKPSISVPKETVKITWSPEKIQNPSEVKIKTEVKSPNPYGEDNGMNSEKNGNLNDEMLDDVHVDMTFEAETCDEGEEEDVPLVLLKNKPTDMINPPIQSTSKVLISEIMLSPDKTNVTADNNVASFPPSLFIKKELIEDEIVSESPAVSATSLSPIPEARSDASISSLPVKIKSEPIDTEYFPENHTKNNLPTSLEPFNNQLSSECSSIGLSKKTPKKKKKSNASESFVTTSTSESNSFLVRLLQGENLSPGSISNTNTHISSNSISENANFTQSSLTELLDSSKPKTKKSVSKKKRVVKKKATSAIDGFENPFAQLAPYSPEIPSTLTNPSYSDSGNLSVSISNSNDFNINSQNASYDTISETIESVIRESVNALDNIEADNKQTSNLSETIESVIRESVNVLDNIDTVNKETFIMSDTMEIVNKEAVNLSDTMEIVNKDSVNLSDTIKPIKISVKKQIKGKTKTDINVLDTIETNKESVDLLYTIETVNKESVNLLDTAETVNKNCDNLSDTIKPVKKGTVKKQIKSKTKTEVNLLDTIETISREASNLSNTMETVVKESVNLSDTIKPIKKGSVKKKIKRKTKTKVNLFDTIEPVNKESVNLSDSMEIVDKKSLNLSNIIEALKKGSISKEISKIKMKAQFPSMMWPFKKYDVAVRSIIQKLFRKYYLGNISLTAFNSKILVHNPDDYLSETEEEYMDSETDTAFEAEFREDSPKKEKKKSNKKDAKIDENLPITLLIKRQKTDTDAKSIDSFLCTNLTSKSSTVNSSSVYNDMQGLDFDECEGISYVPQNTKKKRTGNRKTIKKKTSVKDSNFSDDTELEEAFSGKSNVKKGKKNYFSSESTTMDGFTDMSSQDKLYTPLSSSDSQGEESSTSYQTSVSGDVNSQSQMSNLNSLSVSPKKKKRQRRSNGWYKKKKSRKVKQNSRKSVTSAEVQSPVLDMSRDPDPLLSTVKTPIVVIKNLDPELLNFQGNYVKVMQPTTEIQNAENSRAKINLDREELTAEKLDEKLTITSSSKVKKSKGNKSRKKMPQASLKNNNAQDENTETLSETDKTSVNDSIETICLQNELPNASTERSRNNSFEGIINESGNISSAQKKDSTVTVAESNSNTTRGFHASINIGEFQNKIKVLEAMLPRIDNSDRLRQNLHGSDLRTAGIQNLDSINQILQNRSQLTSFRAGMFNQEPIFNATRRNYNNTSFASIKSEKVVDFQTVHQNTTSNYNESCASTSHRIGNQTDRLVSVENANRNTVAQNSGFSRSFNAFQDSIGLAIKKEKIHNMSPVSNNTSCRPDKELGPITTSQKKSLELLSDEEIQIIPPENAKKDIPVIELDDDDDNLLGAEQHILNRARDNDDITSISSRFIELSKQIKKEKDDSETSFATPEAPNEIIQTSNVSNKVSSFSFQKSVQSQDTVDPSKVRTVVSDSDFSCNVPEDPIKRETTNPFIVRGKYINEYFKHLFPPSQASYKKRRNRSKMYERIDSTTWNLSIDEVESRLKHAENTMPQFGKKLGDITKLEKYPVSKSEVECYHRILGVAPSHKLLSKCSMMTPNQKFFTEFNNLLNKFDHSEMESKNTSSLAINHGFLQAINESQMMPNNFDSEQNLIAFNRDCPSTETRDSFDSSVSHSTDKYVNAVLDKNIEQSNSAILKQNELSSNLISQNSALSGISNSEDISNNAITNIDTSSNAPSDYNSSSVILSNEVSTFPYLQNNALTNLNLPSQEVVNSMLNSAGTCHSTIFESSDTTSKSVAESANITTVNTAGNNELPLPPSYSNLESGVPSDVTTNVPQTPTNTNTILDLINIPVLELRKILDTATLKTSTCNDNEIVQSGNINNALLHDNSVICSNLQMDAVNRGGIWKNKETFEYNHVRSTPAPVTNADSDQNTELPRDDLSKSDDEDTGEQDKDENSEDEYVDNEPITYASDNEKSDSSSQESEEPPIPQYKSKWEKIMERKSQEFKEKKKISDLYLKDCVPVSSLKKPPSKRNSIYSKDTESSDKKSQEPEEKTSSKVQNSKPDNKKQSESKTKTRTEESEKNNKSQKTAKKTEKQSSKTNDPRTAKKVEKLNSKTNDPETAKKGPPKKNKGKESEEVPNLFEVPDKLVKTSPVKNSSATVKSNEKKEKPKFYGNRVTNRGTFLTEATPAKGLASIKIPKKSIETTKKSAGVRSDEFHSMVKSPDIDLPRTSSGRNFNRGNIGNRSIDNRKNSEEYRSPLSNTSPSVTSHFIRTKRMRDRQNAYLNSYSPYARKNIPQNKTPILPTPEQSSPYINDETMQNRSSLRSPPIQHLEHPHKKPLLPTPFPKQSPSYLNDEILDSRSPLLSSPPIQPQEYPVGNKIPVLCTQSSNFPEPLSNVLSNHQENSIGCKIPVLLSGSSQVSSDSAQPLPSTECLENILSIFKRNPNKAPQVGDKMNPENTDAGWNNNQYNSPYGAPESSVAQNINPQHNTPFDSMASVNNQFRNLSQVVDSLNLPRTAVGSQLNLSGLPFNPVAPINAPLTDTLDPRRASLGLQPNMLSNSAISGSPSLTETLDPRRAALGLQPNMPLGVSSAEPTDPRRNALMSQTNTPVGSLMSSNLINIPLSDNLDPRKAAYGVNKKTPEIPFNTVPQFLNSPPHITPAPQQPPRRATCLVPSHLKNLVGLETIDTHNVRLLMLEWSVDWLTQQQKNRDPPPISKSLKKVSSSYDSFEDYYNTYFPLMLLDTWHRIYASWTHLHQTPPFLCQITSYSVKTHFVNVDCQTVFSTDNRPKGVFPDEGSIIIVKYGTKSNEYTIKILGYVTYVKTRRYNPVTDSKLCSSLSQNVNVNPDSLQILTLTFMGAYNSEDIDKRQPVRLHVLCNVKPNLKQNDAMLYINKSPLQRSILNPVADGLLTFSLTPRNSPEDKVNECVRDITKGILSPHPLPLLTVVRAKPESDRLNIIPLLILKMKTVYKTKVLLCVRTVRALGDIAANICLQQSLKLVIINKRCDTNLQFQKFLLDELVACEARRMEEGAIGEKKLGSEACIKIKKEIIKDCDVILSLIKNSHDEFLDETFHETESVSQMCCIVDEANLCTEPETLIPILHGISKLILIGDPDYNAKVVSKTAIAYDFNQSFFQRAYDLDLLTE